MEVTIMQGGGNPNGSDIPTLGSILSDLFGFAPDSPNDKPALSEEGE